jgi:hypothetical protein
MIKVFSARVPVAGGNSWNSRPIFCTGSWNTWTSLDCESRTFAVRALETCPDGRDRITKHMLALSTYLGHSKVADTYWYLQATPDLMRNIADSCQGFFSGGRP